ncbi:MAG: hypothetical protein RMJ39_05280 [Deltaproteobacteria bacterium]|nr:hypothetical protein [Deltaproteobacteria bacterium]
MGKTDGFPEHLLFFMIVDIALPYPLSHSFSYNVPPNWKPYIFESQRVIVPFKERQKKGYVVGLREGEDPALKEIFEPIDLFPLLTPNILKLISWIKDNFLIPQGILMKYALSDKVGLEDFVIVRTEEKSDIDGLTLKKAIKKYGKETLFFLFKSGRISFQEIFHMRAIGPYVEIAKNLKSKGTIFVGPFEKRVGMYISEIDTLLKNGKSCLFFVPPYGFSGKFFFEILKERFKDRVFWLGHETKKRERMKIFLTLRSLHGYVILSNVLGLFLPVSHLGLLILERPEDSYFPIDTDFGLSLLDSVIERSKIEGVPLLIGTISPPLSLKKSIDSFEVIKDMADFFSFKMEIQERERRYDEASSLFAIKEKLIVSIGKGEDTAIFFPRRYYAGKMECLNCKRVLFCPKCKKNLSFSKEKRCAFCQRCEESVNYEGNCPFCKSPYVALRSFGIEFLKELIEKESFDAKILLLDEDKQDELRDLKEKKEKPAVILGTKTLSYLYFPTHNLILAGWKELKKIWGYSAYEKFFQLFYNLFDSLKPKKVYFFGAKPDDLEILYIREPERFYEEELKKREELGFPPSKRLILIEVSRKERERLEKIRLKIEEYLSNEGLKPYLYGERLYRQKTGFTLRIILSAPKELSSKIFPLFDLYGVKIRVDPDTI